MTRYLWLLVALMFLGTRPTLARTATDDAVDPAMEDTTEFVAEDEDTSALPGTGPRDSRANVEPVQDPNKAYLRGDAAAVEAKPTKPSSSPSGVLAAFAVLVVLGVAAAYFSRKRVPRELRGAQIQLAVVAKLGLGPKAQVALVSVGREALLIGVTEQGITTLRTYAEAELASLTPAAVQSKTDGALTKSGALSPAAPSALFQSLLEKASGVKTAATLETSHYTARPASNDTDEEVPDHLARALDAAGLSGRGFEAPEGQAKELAQRFKELRS